MPYLFNIYQSMSGNKRNYLSPEFSPPHAQLRGKRIEAPLNQGLAEHWQQLYDHTGQPHLLRALLYSRALELGVPEAANLESLPEQFELFPAESSLRSHEQRLVRYAELHQQLTLDFETALKNVKLYNTVELLEQIAQTPTFLDSHVEVFLERLLVVLKSESELFYQPDNLNKLLAIVPMLPSKAAEPIMGYLTSVVVESSKSKTDLSSCRIIIEYWAERDLNQLKAFMPTWLIQFKQSLNNTNQDYLELNALLDSLQKSPQAHEARALFLPGMIITLIDSIAQNYTPEVTNLTTKVFELADDTVNFNTHQKNELLAALVHHFNAKDAIRWFPLIEKLVHIGAFSFEEFCEQLVSSLAKADYNAIYLFVVEVINTGQLSSETLHHLMSEVLKTIQSKPNHADAALRVFAQQPHNQQLWEVLDHTFSFEWLSNLSVWKNTNYATHTTLHTFLLIWLQRHHISIFELNQFLSPYFLAHFYKALFYDESKFLLEHFRPQFENPELLSVLNALAKHETYTLCMLLEDCLDSSMQIEKFISDDLLIKAIEINLQHGKGENLIRLLTLAEKLNLDLTQHPTVETAIEKWFSEKYSTLFQHFLQNYNNRLNVREFLTTAATLNQLGFLPTHALDTIFEALLEKKVLSTIPSLPKKLSKYVLRKLSKSRSHNLDVTTIDDLWNCALLLAAEEPKYLELMNQTLLSLIKHHRRGYSAIITALNKSGGLELLDPRIAELMIDKAELSLLNNLIKATDGFAEFPTLRERAYQKFNRDTLKYFFADEQCYLSMSKEASIYSIYLLGNPQLAEEMLDHVCWQLERAIKESFTLSEIKGSTEQIEKMAELFSVDVYRRLRNRIHFAIQNSLKERDRSHFQYDEFNPTVISFWLTNLGVDGLVNLYISQSSSTTWLVRWADHIYGLEREFFTPELKEQIILVFLEHFRQKDSLSFLQSLVSEKIGSLNSYEMCQFIVDGNETSIFAELKQKLQKHRLFDSYLPVVRLLIEAGFPASEFEDTLWQLLHSDFIFKINNDQLTRLLQFLKEVYHWQPEEFMALQKSLSGTVTDADSVFMAHMTLPTLIETRQLGQAPEYWKAGLLIQERIISINRNLRTDLQTNTDKFWLKHFQIINMLLMHNKPLCFEVVSFANQFGFSKLTTLLDSFEKLSDQIKKQICQIDGLSAAQFQAIIELANAFKEVKNPEMVFEKVLEEALTKSHSFGEVITFVSHRLFANYSKKLGVTSEQLRIDLESSWDLYLMPHIFAALETYPEDVIGYLKLAIKMDLLGEIDQVFQLNPAAPNPKNYTNEEKHLIWNVYQHQEKVREEFKKNGISFDHWYKYQPQAEILIGEAPSEQKVYQLTENLESILMEIILAIKNAAPDPKRFFVSRIPQFANFKDLFGLGKNGLELLSLAESDLNRWQVFTEGVRELMEQIIAELQDTTAIQKLRTAQDHLLDVQEIIKEAKIETEKKAIRISVKDSPKKPGKYLFHGNYTHCCLAVGNSNRGAIVDYFWNSSVKVFEMVDEASGKEMGQIYTLLVKDNQNNVYLMIDNIELTNTHMEFKKEIRESSFKYIWEFVEYLNSVSETQIQDVLMGVNYQDVDTQDLTRVTMTLTKVGDSLFDTEYFDWQGGWRNPKNSVHFTGVRVPNPQRTEKSLQVENAKISVVTGSSAHREKIWKKVKKDLVEVEQHAFGDYGESEDHLQRYLTHPETIFIMVEIDNRVVGYSCALPVDDYQGKKMMYVQSTAIHPDLQGQGLVWKIMDELDQTAKSRGISYLSRDARTANNYAHKLLHRYNSAVVVHREHDSIYGPQAYMVIDLDKVHT